MKKILTISSIITIAIVGILIIRKFNRKKEHSASTNSNTQSNSASGVDNIKKPLPDSDFPLQLGSTGKHVLNLQKALNKFYHAGLSEDGIFGIRTERACVRYLGVKIIKVPNYLYYKNQ